MKISDVKTFLVHPGIAKNLCFVKIETDSEIFGWGECYTQTDRDTQIVSHIEQIKRYLIGRDPRNIKHFTQSFFNDFAGRRGSMEFFCAISGLEQAMWDITGKLLNAPVHQLLGGAFRNKIRVYANGWTSKNIPEEYDSTLTKPLTQTERLSILAKETVKSGFTALKFDPIPGPWRTHIDKTTEYNAIENVAAVRNAVGDEIDIMVEIHRRLSPSSATKIAKSIEKYNPFWFEEPVLAKNIKALEMVKKSISIPVVTGEELYTKFEFPEVFERQAADIINPDICNVGGILELKEIAAMAEPYFIGVSPHNYNSTTIGLAATLQLCATIPNFIITEYFTNLESFGNKISKTPLKIENGYIELPNSPGLGMELNESILEQYPYKQFPPKPPVQYFNEGP